MAKSNEPYTEEEQKRNYLRSIDINAIGTLGLRLVKILTKDSVAWKLIGHQQRRGNL